MTLDFQKSPKPRNYLARREQRRLLVMALLLGLVIVLVFQARDPGNYRWLESRPAAHSPDEGAEPDQPPSRYLPGVNLEYLANVQDNRPFHPDEHHAWFHLLGLASRTDQRTLQEHSTDGVTFVQLYRQSELYRGELVSFRGEVRRASEKKASKNEYGVDKTFRLWILMADNRRDPITVDVLELPDGFPLGDKLQEEVEVTGFFFKRRAYLGQEEIFTTPSLLASTVRWQKRADNTRTSPGLSQVLAATAVAAGLSMLIVWFAASRNRSRRRRTNDSEADVVMFDNEDVS